MSTCSTLRLEGGEYDDATRRLMRRVIHVIHAFLVALLGVQESSRVYRYVYSPFAKRQLED